MSLTISMDDALKSDFSRVCSEIGMSVSTAINVFAKKVVREQRIPFELTAQSAAEQGLGLEARERERLINEAMWRGYDDFRTGRTFTLDDLAAEHAKISGSTNHA